MGAPVNTVASGGIAVVDVTATTPKLGAPVSEALPGKGTAVTKVANYGVPVTFETIGIGQGVTYATWDLATVTSVTLSGGNLVATNAGTTSDDQGAKGASTIGKSTDKYYFESTWTTVLGGNNTGVGVGTFASTYTSIGLFGTTGIYMKGDGTVYSGGSLQMVSGGVWTAGQTYGFAIDLDNRKFWRRLAPSGNWNNNATYNPATNTGGLTIPAGTMVPFGCFGGNSGVAGNVMTANFGASAFSGTVPSGFTSGWPA